MAGISLQQQAQLSEAFGKRVTFDRTECLLYSHDVGSMPKLIRPLLGSSVADGVIQPLNEQELVWLLKWAYDQGIALTPRGKATSGYGGVIPVRNGLVVDLSRMRSICSIDKEALTATVECGVTWEQLDRALDAQGLTLRLYPTSYPSSTVGGWLAQGGTGIGGYEYGYFEDNVVSARVVLPNGQVQELELNRVAYAEGITGIISQVTLRVAPKAKIEVQAISCTTPTALQALAEAIIAADLPIWSMMFINPTMAELKAKAPAKAHGDVSGGRVLLPPTYIVTLAYREADAGNVRSRLPAILESVGAELLDEQIARHEWEERFNLMLVKRLGPSLVPAEVVVPLAHLATSLAEIEASVAQPIVKEGVIIRRGIGEQPEAVILGFIPSDERQLSYNFVFGLSLSIVDIAERYGGRAYATGLYFAKKADRILGRERVQRLRAVKREVDPKGLLNPGKVIGNRFIATMLQTAAAFEPLIRKVGNLVPTKVGERIRSPMRGIPADVAWYAYACAQCGYCVDECDQYYGRGWESQSPRGKWYWLRQYIEGRVDWDQKMVDTFLACTTCELCNVRCSVNLPIEAAWMKLRGQLIEQEKRMTFPPFEMMAAALSAEGDIWAGYRKDRAAWFPSDLRAKHGPQKKSKAVYFAGCTASYVEQDIGIASVRLLDAAGIDFSYLGEKENCCATPMLVAGKWELFAETMQANIRAVKEAGADTVITSCPACDLMWRQVYPAWARKLDIDFGITTKHYSEIIAESIREGRFTFPENGHESRRVTWHDSCHIGRASGIYEPPRELIRAIPHAEFVEMAHNREEAHCCGSVLTLIKEPAVAAEVGKVRLDEAIAAGAETVLALCPCCQFQLRVSAAKKEVPLEVVDLAHFCAEALGYELPDPNPSVQAQWAVFEAMIALMTPQGFADLMGTMWPELIEAMPLGMGQLMRAIGRMGVVGRGMLGLMKPLFPVLFPILLPRMMPKVLPTMLERVAERIPMPDYMAEQMPSLMPKVMDNLMPHMIGDVVPLVTQPMIDYLTASATRI